jgi:hypothetical protein
MKAALPNRLDGVFLQPGGFLIKKQYVISEVYNLAA